MFQNVSHTLIEWMMEENTPLGMPLCDFEGIRYEIRPGDVLLIEGRTRVSEVIRQITQSVWSHACLYVGRLHDIDSLEQRELISKHFNGDPNLQVVIEGYAGRGTIVTPLETYRGEHIRICRPSSLSRQDAQKVIHYAIEQLGKPYDLRGMIDLARFLLPWSILPKEWRSSLFGYRAGLTTKTACSTMIAAAFSSIDFPILPVIQQHEETGLELFHKHPRFITPRDFDYSPYFEIIKFPFMPMSEEPYRRLPWNKGGSFSYDGKNITHPEDLDIKIKENELSVRKYFSRQIARVKKGRNKEA